MLLNNCVIWSTVLGFKVALAVLGNTFHKIFRVTVPVPLIPHPLDVSMVSEGQGERGCPHRPTIPKGAASVELSPGWLEDVIQFWHPQLLQHLNYT